MTAAAKPHLFRVALAVAPFSSSCRKKPRMGQSSLSYSSITSTAGEKSIWKGLEQEQYVLRAGQSAALLNHQHCRGGSKGEVSGHSPSR